MDALPHGLAGWAFWFFGALALNLLSSYAKPYADKWFDHLSTSRKFKSQKAKDEFNKSVEELLADPTEAILYNSFIGQGYTMLCVLLLSFLYFDKGNNILSVLVGIVVAFVFFVTMKRTSDRIAVIKEYRRRRKERYKQESNAQSSV